MNIFISHITQHGKLALAIKDWIESTFTTQCKVFVSSDPADLPLGEKWLDNIKEALSSSDILIVLSTPISIKRPWINFESGVAWIRGIDVIPICFAGQKKGTLPQPFSEFQAVELTEDKFVELLLQRIVKKLGGHMIPRINYKEMHTHLVELSEAANISELANQSRIERFFDTDYIKHMQRHNLPMEGVLAAFRESKTIEELSMKLRALSPNPIKCSYFNVENMNGEFLGMINLSRECLGNLPTFRNEST